MDQELKAYLDDRFGEIDRRLDQMDRRFEQVEETVRHTQVLVEGLRHENRLIAEGLFGVIGQLRQAADGLDVIKGWIEPYERNLDARVRILEDRAERQQGDVMDAVRKFVGQPPLKA